MICPPGKSVFTKTKQKKIELVARPADISKQPVNEKATIHKRKRSTEASSEDELPSTSRTNNEQKKKTVTKAGLWGEKNSASSDPKRMKMIAPLPLPQVWQLTQIFIC